MKRIIIWLMLAMTCSQGTYAYEQSILCDAEPTDMVVEYGTIVSCSLDTSGDSDIYRFNGQSGEVLVIQTTYDDGSTRPCIELFGPDNSIIEACDNAFSNRIDTVLNQTGTYSIIVSDWFGTGTGGYTIGLDCIIPSSQENQEINFAEEIIGEINPVGELDLFNLASGGNDYVLITASYIGGGLRPCIELIGPDNSRVEACSNAFSNQIDAMLDQAGTYSIMVNDWFGTQTGEYSISLQCISGDCVDIDNDTDDTDTDNTDTDDTNTDDTDTDTDNTDTDDTGTDDTGTNDTDSEKKDDITRTGESSGSTGCFITSIYSI